MRPKSVIRNLPMINKSKIYEEISNHHLFRQRIVKLKAQRMKDIIQRNHNTFFNKESSISSISQIKDKKNNINLSSINIPHMFKRNTSDIFSKSKESSSINKKFFPILLKKSDNDPKRYFLNTYRDLKINYSKYFYIKNNEAFLKYIINRFINNTKLSPQLDNYINQNYRKIYVILQNSIVTNYNDIPGFFINIPNYNLMQALSYKKRQKLYENLLKKLPSKFKSVRKITSLFSPNKDTITDLLEIKNEFKFIYASPTSICKSISIVLSPNFIDLYHNEYQDFILGIKKNNFNLNKKRKNKIKIKNITKGIRAKYEKLKPHYSFSAGENDIENINYLYYSDNEEEKNKIEKIKNKYLNKKHFLKNDFFIYLNEQEIDAKLKLLKENINFKTPFKLKESYDNFNIEINYEKILSRFRQELFKKYDLNPKKYFCENNSKKNRDFDFGDVEDIFTKLFLKKEKVQLNKKINKKIFTNTDKRVNKQYSYLISYNIPKIIKDPNLRKILFEIFIQFKDLLSIALSLRKNDFILKKGIDFDTFWNCIKEVQNEKEIFAERIFTYMNKSNSSLLNIEDFIKGMLFLKNAKLNEKLDIYVHSMEIENLNKINFEDAVKISKKSILKKLDGIVGKNINLVLNELSTFLASFVFEVIGCEKNKSINLDDLKKIIIKSYENDNKIKIDKQDIGYLEMFFGI